MKKHLFKFIFKIISNLSYKQLILHYKQRWEWDNLRLASSNAKLKTIT